MLYGSGNTLWVTGLIILKSVHFFIVLKRPKNSETKFTNWAHLEAAQLIKVKTESTRKLSNFNYQWIKTLYQNNFNHIAFLFLHFSRAINVISCNVISNKLYVVSYMN